MEGREKEAKKKEKIKEKRGKKRDRTKEREDPKKSRQCRVVVLESGGNVGA